MSTTQKPISKIDWSAVDLTIYRGSVPAIRAVLDWLSARYDDCLLDDISSHSHKPGCTPFKTAVETDLRSTLWPPEMVTSRLSGEPTTAKFVLVFDGNGLHHYLSYNEMNVTQNHHWESWRELMEKLGLHNEFWHGWNMVFYPA